MDRDRIDQLKGHILKYQAHCDRWLSRLCDPAGKNVLVVGSGWGTEVLWALRHGASKVTGVDPADRSSEPLAEVINETFQEYSKLDWEIKKTTTLELKSEDRFDLIVSNNVFEHIDGLKVTFRSLRPLLSSPKGRIAIFTDPLFYSSNGSHLPVKEWQHLYDCETRLAESVPAWKWREYMFMLNRMTITDFLQAARESEIILLDLFIIKDRNLDRINEYLPRIRHRSFPLDLALEGIGVLMCFPENV